MVIFNPNIERRPKPHVRLARAFGLVKKTIQGRFTAFISFPFRSLQHEHGMRDTRTSKTFRSISAAEVRCLLDPLALKRLQLKMSR